MPRNIKFSLENVDVFKYDADPKPTRKAKNKKKTLEAISKTNKEPLNKENKKVSSMKHLNKKNEEECRLI